MKWKHNLRIIAESRVSHADSKLNGGILRHDCGFLCPNATDAFSRINARSAPTRQNRLARCALVVYYFDLFINHLPGEAIGCSVHPVMLLAFHNEIRRLIAFGL